MTNKKAQTLLMSGLFLLMSVFLVVVGTFALFSDTAKLKNHLEAGNLKLTLERTSLNWTAPDDETGYLVSGSDNELVDFSKPNDKNIFGLKDDSLIVPGTSYEAIMVISNKGDVAFGYWLEIVISSDNDKELAEQIKVTITLEDGTEKVHFLTEGLSIGSESSPVGEMAKDSKPQKFSIKVEFVDNEKNNQAMNQNMSFDLIVNAIQKNKK